MVIARLEHIAGTIPLPVTPPRFAFLAPGFDQREVYPVSVCVLESHGSLRVLIQVILKLSVFVRIMPVLVYGSVSLVPATLCLAGSSSATPRPTGAGTPLDSDSMLLESYERFLKNHDIDGFRTAVFARYTEGTLSRLTQSTDVRSRRASVLALGFNGGMGCNASLASALKDPDPTVRALAVNALWAMWSRADRPENNVALDEVQGLLERGQFAESIKRANALIARAPTFAEAYNQRAIAHFLTGNLAESAEDCRKVLGLNPYHFGALAGLGKCQLRLRQKTEAIRTFRRALDLQPYSEDLRETIAALEAAQD